MNYITINSNYTDTISKYNMSMDTQLIYNESNVREFIYDYEEFVDTEWVDLEEIVLHIIKTIPEKLTKNEFYNYVADYCVSKTSIHPDYNKLASRICVDRLHLSTPDNFCDAVEILYNNGGNGTSLVSENLLRIVKQHHKQISKVIDIDRDYLFDYFGMKTLERSYLLKVHTKNKKKIIVERPQYMIMRVALGIHGDNLKEAFETYNLISLRYFTHATPTLFNAGTNRPQLSSCFLADTEVLTINEGIKKIQDVKIGDEVVTHTGNVQKVLQLHKNKLGDRNIYKLKVTKTKDIYVTGNHKFLSSTDKQTSCWNSIDTLKSGDYIAIPNYEAESKNIILDVSNYMTDDEKNELNKINFNTKWELTIDSMKLLGMCLCNNMNFDITESSKNSDIITFVKNTSKNLFGLDCTEESYYMKLFVDFVRVTFNPVIRSIITKLFLNDIIPQQFYKLPTETLYGFIDGIKFYNHSQAYYNDDNIIISISSKIANQLYHLLRSRGIDVQLNDIQLNDEFNTTKIYIPKKNAELNNDICIVIGGQKYLRIDKIEKTDLKPEHVYTLGVEQDHSYNVEGLICENCFLFSIEDSLESIMEITKQIALISKWAGGIGVSLSSIRARGSLIKGTNGISDGIIPLCGVLNKLSKYVNQGGKRPGSIACYLETWHADIYEFMELRKANSGNDDNRARDLFLASWIPDLFMERVKIDGMWSLMCPNECPGLDKTHGEEFEKLYLGYEQNKKYKRQVKARDLMKHLLECQIETGFTYMCYKDQCNNKSNQKNLGTIRCSNLCSEIVEYSDGNTTAVCNLASICLPRFIVEVDGNKQFNYDFLEKVVRVAVRNLNKVIDINFYPTEQTAKSNNQTRPIGLGVQGLADVYNIFGYAYESDEASLLNRRIFETIYYASVDESKELAKKFGAYQLFKGSPFSEGKLQFHLWNIEIKDLLTNNKYDWYKLVEEVKKYGTRNSLLTALMPTAGTSQLMKCYESFEPYISNIFVKTTMAGEFIVINEQLVKDLIKLDLWSEDMRKLIIINNGSVQTIDSIPQKIKEIYKTAFEIKLKSMINQSADRAPFIDQTQSMNLFMKNPKPKSLLSTHFYAWEKGLKTGMYYLRGSSSVNPIQFGIDITDIMRLTGRSNPIELISGEFNLELTESADAHSEAPVKLNMEHYAKIKTERDGCEETESTEVGCLMCSG